MPISFFAFLFSRATTSLASTMFAVSIGWHLYQNSGNPFDLALVGLMQVAPIFLFFFATGLVVDTFSRKIILIVSAIATASIFGTIAMIMASDNLNLFQIFLLIFLQGSIKAFYFPAQQAMIPNIVREDLVSRAVSLNATTGKTFGTLGPVLAGVLISFVDIKVYLISGALMLASATSYFLLPKLVVAKSTGRSLDMLIGGISYVRSNPIILGAISIDLFIVMTGSVMALLPVFATDILDVGPESLGVLRAMPALGGVVVGALIAFLPAMRQSGACLFIALLVFSFSILVFSLSTTYWISLAALFLYGGADMVSVNIRMTLIQLATPDRLRGRVSTVNSIFISSSNEMGDVRAGSAAALLGPVTATMIGSIMAFGVTFLGWRLFPKLSQLDKLIDCIPDEAKASKGEPNDGK